MTGENSTASVVVDQRAVATPPITPEWQRWIAEKLLLRLQPSGIVEALTQHGFDRATATQEVQTAQNHPYLAAVKRIALGEQKIAKRDWVLEVYRRSARQSSTFGQVARIARPSPQEFLDRYYATNTPVIIEGAMDDWPALKLWTLEYLQRRVGDPIVEIHANRNADPNYEMNTGITKRNVRFSEYLRMIESGGESNDYYMKADNAAKNDALLAVLWDDIVPFSDLVRSDDPNTRGKMWFGPAGTVTPLHHDLTNNLMAQVRGRKLVRLIAPYELARVYNHVNHLSQVNLDRIDYQRFPAFRDVHVMEVVISPGDVLFLPVAWWHYVRALDISITMTFNDFVFDNDFYSFYTTYREI